MLIVLAILCGAVYLYREKKPETEAVVTALETFLVRSYLREYIDPDTPLVFVHDPEDTAELEAVFRQALRERRAQVCVVGRLKASGGYISNGGDEAVYNNGVFRTMPYSTFWLHSYELSAGALPGILQKLFSAGDRFYLYDFTYYPMQDAEILEIQNSIDREADAIIACIPPDADLWQKCRTIHDELIRRTAYDHTFADHCHDLYGALVRHSAVCEGYALAFRYILNRTGEACDVVVSDWEETPDTPGHAWNRIDGQTYEQYIDVTWDDSDYIREDGEPVIRYEYFGLTDEEITRVDSHAFRAGSTPEIDAPQPFNYYRHEGYLLSAFDIPMLAELFGQQYAGGSSFLTVRFDDPQAYREARDTFADQEALNEVMLILGYTGKYWYDWKDELQILSVGLGALPAAS